MVWKRLFGTPDTPDTDDAAAPAPIDSTSPTPSSPGTPSNLQTARDVPPHLAQIIEKRNPASAPERTPEQRKLEGLRRQRMTMLFDIEQGEMAAAPDNPWTQRMALLTEAMATVEQDVAKASVVVPGPFVALPETQISIDSVTINEVATVTFTIGSERFVYAEDPDWADRSRTITRGDLRLRSGSAGSLIPASTPLELRAQFAYHLGESLLVLATNLRDLSLDAESLPSNATLADLGRPCPVCGGWTDWRGTCQLCAQRQSTLAALRRESMRLLDERNTEAEERHKLIEGLPLARRRLRDVEAELARLGEQVG
jgi:hypothetical protein